MSTIIINTLKYYYSSIVILFFTYYSSLVLTLKSITKPPYPHSYRKKQDPVNT